MQKSWGNPLLIVLVLLVGFAAGTRYDDLYRTIAPVFGVKVAESSIPASALNETYRQLLKYYDGDVSIEDAQDGAIKGLVAATKDPYTSYFTAREAEEFNKELNGEVGAGIGAEIAVRYDQPTIVRVLADHPARAAGVMAGDVIYKVNGESMRNKTSAEAADKIRGEEGTTVKLTVLREGEEKVFTITRRTIQNPSVRSEIKAGNVGYISVSRFDDNTGGLAKVEAQKLLAKRVKGIVLDLRGNGGGTLDAAVDVAGLWLDKKVVVREKSGGKVTDELTSNPGALLAGVKTIVLVDESSASASEIVAGALHDYKVARLVGKTTFGKGTVQRLVDMRGGAMLKVTVARWYTPKNVNVTAEGIAPDIEVAITSEQINRGEDPQLARALQELK